MNRREILSTTSAFVACSFISNSSLAATPNAYTYSHMDVFTDAPLTGNQCAVFMHPAGLSSEQMMSLTREVSFAETTFVLPAEAAGTDFRVRIFARGGEVPVAGSPTIGTAFALAHARKIKPGSAKVVFGLGVGPTDVDLRWEGGKLKTAWMHQVVPQFGGTIKNAAAVAAALGLSAQDMVDPRYPIQEVSNGQPFLIVPLQSREAVDKAVMDGAAMRLVNSQEKLTSGAAFIFSTESNSDGETAYARFLGLNGVEDAATGIAVGPLGAYLVRYGLVSPAAASQMRVREGVKMHRSSELLVAITASGNQITSVSVGGAAVELGQSSIIISQ